MWDCPLCKKERMVVVGRENMEVYLFCALILGSSKREYLKQAQCSGTPERRELVNLIMMGYDRDYNDGKIHLVPTKDWCDGYVHPSVFYALEPSEVVVKLAEKYLINQGIATAKSLEELCLIERGVGMSHDYKIVYFSVVVDAQTKRAVKRGNE